MLDGHELGLPASENARDTFLWFISYPVCGILLQQPDKLRNGGRALAGSEFLILAGLPVLLST